MKNDKIEELKEEIAEKVKDKYHNHKKINIIDFGDGRYESLEADDFDRNCDVCLDIQELYAKLQAYEEAQKEINDLKEEIKICKGNYNALVDICKQMEEQRDTWKERYHLGQKVFCETYDRLKEQTSKKVEKFNNYINKEKERALRGYQEKAEQFGEHINVWFNDLQIEFNEIFTPESLQMCSSIEGGCNEDKPQRENTEQERTDVECNPNIRLGTDDKTSPEEDLCECGHPESNHLDHRFNPPRLNDKCGFPILIKDRGFKRGKFKSCDCKKFTPKKDLTSKQEAIKELKTEEGKNETH